MRVKGFFISVISPQGGSGVSTISIALGADLISKSIDTVLLTPGANYEYYPEFESNNKFNLTEAYFLYTKGKSICSELDFNKSNKKTLEAFINKLNTGYKTELTFYSPFNNFMEADEIPKSDYIKFLTEGFKCKEVIIIDTGRIPPFKLCDTLNSSDLILIVVDCRDELYLYKTKGFLKSIMKAVFQDGVSLSSKIFLVLNYGTDKDEGLVRDLIKDFSFLADTKIYIIPRLPRIYTGKLNASSFNGRLFKRTDIGKISDEINMKKEV